MHASSLLLLGLLLPACLVGPPGYDEPRPFRDQWQVELDLPMVLEGTGSIDVLRIGGPEHEGNFAGRGDVIVEVHDEDRIVVELRRFATGYDEADAEDTYDDLGLWAFVGGDRAPQRPEDMVFPRPCETDSGVLRDDCGLRVYYDGLSQPRRAGADIRVTLPARYARGLGIYTQDLAADANYINRGDVCVQSTRAQVSVQLERGVAFGSIAPPTAAPEAIPSLTIRGDATDVWLDSPADLRTAVVAAYEDDAEKDERCWLDPAMEGFTLTDSSFGSSMSMVAGIAGPDPEPARIDAKVAARASTCDVVAFTESPDEWVPQAEDQAAEVRGVINLCNDCVRSTPCEELLPGG